MKKKYEDGIYTISNEEYHASSGVSRSKLMLLDKSPYHYWYEVISGEAEKKEATPAMKFGSLFHTLLLEPEKFNENYFIIHQKTMPTESSAPYAKLKVEAGVRDLITQSQVDKAQNMANYVKKHKIATDLLDGCLMEKSIYWTDKETGIQFKCRPDAWASKLILDIKTTDEDIKWFGKSAVKYGYYLQAGMISEGFKAIGKPVDTFVMLICEKSLPHVPLAMPLSERAIQFGIDQFTRYKIELAAHMNKNTWDGYEVQELDVPEYIINELNKGV